MKKILFILTILVCGLASCLQENEQVGPNKPKGANDVTFRMQISSGTVNTRAVAAVGGESKVNDLTLMFFDLSKTGAGEFKGSYKVPKADLPAEGMMAFDLNIPFDSSTGLDKNEAYNILVMANMLNGTYFADGSELDTFLGGLEGKTELAVTQSMALKITGVEYDEKDNTQGFYNEHLPMTVRTSKAEGTADVAVDLVRTVVRFDIIDGNKSDAYTLVSASVWNAFKAPSIWDNATMDYSKARTKRLSGSATTGQDSIVGNLYSVENVSTTPGQNDEKTTCLIIGMKYTGPEADNGAVYYYRLNVATGTENGQYLRRNNVYHTTINNVLDKGEVNEKDAYSGGKFLLDVSVNPWERDENGLVLTDGENVLALPTRKATFGPEADTKQYYVYTSSPADKNYTLELINLELPEGITTHLEGNNLYITVTKFTDTQRKGSIELRYAGLKGTIEIIQRGEYIKYLELNYTQVDIYPAGAAANMIPNTKPIKIASSGPWTATIMGGDEFSFNMSYLVSELKGDNEDLISSIFSRGANPNVKAVTNVVLITLDEDPENYRSVVVLTQKGTGAFVPTPALPNDIKFDADKALVSGGVNIFALQSEDKEDSWNIKITGPHAQKFRLLTYANSTATLPKDTLLAGRELGAGPTDNVKFGVVAAEDNYTGVYNANLEITHNGVVKTIPLQQDVYKLTLTASKTTFDPYGGTSDFTVAFSGKAGMKMNVTMVASGEGASAAVATGYKPVFDDGATSITDAAIGNFKVKVPLINPPFGHLFEENPKITVKVSIAGTPLSKTVELAQEKVTLPTAMVAQETSRSNYATLTDPNYGYQSSPTQFVSVMCNNSYFGPSATVWAPTTISLATGTERVENAHILYVNDGRPRPSYNFFNTGLGTNMGRRLGMFQTHFTYENTFDYVNGAPYTNSMLSSAGSSTTNGYSLSSAAPADITSSKLWMYLVGGDGPFGKVDVNNVNFTTVNTSNVTMINPPSTMIPLMKRTTGASTGGVTMGIDPTYNLIWTTEIRIFRTDLNPSLATPGSDSDKFLKNFVAYIVNAAMYGEYFTKQFR